MTDLSVLSVYTSNGRPHHDRFFIHETHETLQHEKMKIMLMHMHAYFDTHEQFLSLFVLCCKDTVPGATKKYVGTSIIHLNS